MATVIDCHTKACIGYAMAEHMKTDLIITALKMAAKNYRLAEGAIFIPTAAPNTPQRHSHTQPPSWGSAARSGAPGCAY